MVVAALPARVAKNPAALANELPRLEFRIADGYDVTVEADTETEEVAPDGTPTPGAIGVVIPTFAEVRYTGQISLWLDDENPSYEATSAVARLTLVEARQLAAALMVLADEVERRAT